MPIYDEVMTPKGSSTPGAGAAAAPGTGAATDPVWFDEPPMPELDEEEFDSIFAQTTGTPTTVSSRRLPPGVNRANEADAMAYGPAGKVVNLARSFVGTPYKWGGTSPSGFDCSGFLQYIYAKIGVDLPRVSFQQANAGRRVGLGALRAGDLVAWDNSSRNNGADHIAIFLGGGLIAEAPRPGVPLRVRKLGKNERAWGVRVL